MMTKIDYDKLRSNLPRGYGSKLAEITGKSKSAIYQALTGNINSNVIITAAVKLAKKHSQNNNDIISDINNL
ncbi:hypothetical protein E9993_14810 [Labilibacter sediminis]|nr:hypothetical protein E9993_14810 [Labilibacter sediminis]